MGLFRRLKARLTKERNKAIIRRTKKKICAKNVTLISQNCIGGVFYHDMGMQFLSPTINLFIKEPDFVRFVLNLRHYMEQELVMRWEEKYPVGTLDDIEIHFMHYGTCKEAKECWNRRKERINWDKIIVLSTDRDGFDDYVYEQWKQIPYPKVLFTAHAEFTEDAVCYPEYKADGQIGDLISDRSFYRDEVLVRKIGHKC